MVVNFDSFERFELPSFLLCNPGSKYKADGTVSNTVGYLTNTSDEEGVFNFNTTSELNFRIYKNCEIYGSVRNRRLLFLDGIGFFVITAVDEGLSSEGQYKDVTANSCEIELENKKIPIIGEIDLDAAQTSGSYVENNTYDFLSLFEKVIGVCPLWTVGFVDDSLKSTRRTFEDVDTDTNVLSFLLNDMQDAYECIFEFDIINRIVNAYSRDNFVKQTDIHITSNDLVSELEISENSDEIYTALTALGDDDIGLQLANPLGGNTIYNFNYYLNWMSDGLRNRVNEWMSVIQEQLDPNSSDENFYKLRHGYTDSDGNRVKGYFELQQDLADKQAEIDRLSMQLYYYTQLYINISTSTAEADIQEYNNKIEEYGGSTAGISPVVSPENEVSTIKATISGYINECKEKKLSAEEELSALEAEGGAISSNENKIRSIVNSLKMTEFFSSEQQEELSFYIYEGSYDDEYIAVTDDMPWYDPNGNEADRLTQIETLYKRAEMRLAKISSPKCEYRADVENFVFQKQFERWGQQLNAGCLINVELTKGDVAALFLSAITINYHDKSLSFTFGNRFDRLDPKALYEDVLGNVRRTANSISYVKDILYPIKSGEFDAFKEALASSRSLAKDAALNASNQDIVVDDTGLLGRRHDGIGGFDPKQLKLTNRNLVFTDDGWQTCKTALGEIPIPDDNGTTAYGLNAELLVGNIIMASDLRIVDKNNNPVISADEDGIHANFAGNITEENIKDILLNLDKSGFSFSEAFDLYKKYIRVGKINDDNDTIGVKIVHDGTNESFYSQFTADELAFFSRNDGGAYEKNTWMTSDALNIRRARIFDDILLGRENDTDESDPNYGKWSIRVDEDDGLGIFWNG